MADRTWAWRGIGLAALLSAIGAVAVLAVWHTPGDGTPVREEVATDGTREGARPGEQPGEGLAAARIGAPARLRSDTGDGRASPVATPAPPAGDAAAPTLDLLRIGAQGDGVVAGAGAPGAEVVLRLDGQEVATTRADDAGNFVLLFDAPASAVPRVLTLETRDAAGKVARAPGNVIVGPTRPAAEDGAPGGAEGAEALAEAGRPAVEPVPPMAEGPVAALTPRDTATGDAPAAGAGASPGSRAVAAPPRLLRTGPDGVSLLSAEGPLPGATGDLGIAAITYDAAGEVALAGRGRRGGVVRVYLDNRPVALAQVGEDGLWSTPLPDVQTGIYLLRVDAIAADGTVAARLETPFERTAPAIAAAARRDGATAITVQPGFTLWAISEGYFGEGMRYVQLFEANRDLIRDPDLIYPGQVFALPDPGE